MVTNNGAIAYENDIECDDCAFRIENGQSAQDAVKAEEHARVKGHKVYVTERRMAVFSGSAPASAAR